MRELKEIPFDKEHPDFHLEKVSGEFLSIKNAFQNPFVYFVGTSRGCSCDFGVKSNQQDRASLEQVAPMQNILNRIRKISGAYEPRERKRKDKVLNLSNEQAKYLNQSRKLIGIIEDETQKGNSVELYCTWTGDYEAKPEFQEVLHFKEKDFINDFEVEEKEFIKFL